MVDNAPGGHNGVETRLMTLFSEGVATGKISVNTLVAVACTNPARLFGLYPRKGIIAPGSDADIVLVDPRAEKTITLDDLHSDCDYSIWEGHRFRGVPAMTIVRGQVLVENGKWVGATGIGQFVPGKAQGAWR